MKKNICTLLSLSLLTAFAANFRNVVNVSAEEAQNVSADCATILDGIYADAENRDYEVKDSSGADIAVITTGYGTIGSNEQTFTTYAQAYFEGDNWTWISSRMDGDYCWHGSSATYGRDVFLKAEVKRDSYLDLSHAEITGQRTENDETFVKVLVVRNGREYVVSSVARGNTGTNAADSLLSDAGNVKAGDTVYVSVSSQWEARAYFNPVFTFELPKEAQIDVSVDSPELIGNIAADTAARITEIVAEFTPYLSVTAGYGTIGTEEKAFDTYEKDYFAKVENGRYTWLSGADNEYYWWKVGNPNESVFYKATVMEDCWLGLSHAAVDKQMGDYGWTKVAVILKRGNETNVVSEVTRSTVDVKNDDNTFSTPANALLKNVGNVKKGDVVYVAVIGNEWGAEVRFDPVFNVKATDKVEEAKTAAKAEIEIYASLDDYREREKVQVSEAIAAGKTAIDGADSVEKVTEALAEAKAAIDEIKTDEELTAEEAKALADAKTAAKAEIETYASLDDYREREKAQVSEAIAAGKTAIDGADSVEKVTEALAEAKASIDEIKTDEELTAEEAKALADAKTAAKAGLETYASFDDYREREKAQVSEAIAAGKTAIDGADSVEKVTEALAEAKAAIDEIKTDEELTAEEAKALADAKTAAKAEIETYASLDDYREAEKAQVREAITAGKTAIDGADSVEKVTEALAEAKASIDEIKTDEELTEEESNASSGSSSGSGTTTVSGCGSAIGLGTGASVILGAAACFLKKRKR